MSAHKKHGFMRYCKMALAVLALSAVISHWPKIPHYAADGIVWCANAVTSGVALGITYATAQTLQHETSAHHEIP